MLAAAAALAAIPYLYNRFDEEIRRCIQGKIAGHYSRLAVRLRSAQLIQGEGIELRGLSIADPSLAGPQAELSNFDEVLLCCDTSVKELLSNCPTITRIKIRRPVLRATSRPDGTWSIQQLHPWPKFGEATPEVEVDGATLEIVDPLKSPSSTYTLRDIHLLLKPVRSGPGQPCIFEVSGSMAADQVQKVAFTGTFDPATAAYDIRGSVEGLDISPELRASLPASISERLHCLRTLRAQARCDFRVAHHPKLHSGPQFRVDGQLIRGRLDDVQLPYPLTDLQGRVHLTNAGFTLDEVTARSGRTTLRLSCSRRGYSSLSPLKLEAVAEHLQLEPRLADSLPEPLRDSWYKYLPDGEVNAEVKLTFDGQRWQPQLQLTCIDTSFTFYKFPYRLEHATGRISLEQDRLTVGLTAYTGGEPVRIAADVRQPGPHFTGWIQVDGDNIPFEEKLFAALRDNSQAVVRSLNPRGTFNVNARH